MFLPELYTSLAHNDSLLLDGAQTVDTCHDIDNCRTLWQIIRSCLVTIFACTWVSLHLNIPPRREFLLKGPLRHLGITLLGLLAPELIVAWAARQWFVAIELGEKYSSWTGQNMPQAHSNQARAQADNPLEKLSLSARDPFASILRVVTCRTCNCNELEAKSNESGIKERNRHPKPWSRTHGFFALMGGYVLCYEDGKEEVLDADANHDFLDFFKSEDSCTRLTEEELADKGKKDWLSKTFAVVQTVWFVLQCIARAVEGRALSEMEVGTCAFAFFSAVTYGLWWNKPQAVKYPFKVPISRSREEHDISSVNTSANIERTEGLEKAEAPKAPNACSYPTKPASRQAKQAHFGARSGVWYLLTELAGDDRWYDPELKDASVPTFFSGRRSSLRDDVAIGISVAFSVVFGAIHCTAWSFTFPSHIEALLWRICALATACLPLLRLTTYVLQRRGIASVKGQSQLWMRAVTYSIVISYIAARAVLIALVFTLLRALPSSAYETVSWSLFIPHV